MTALERLAKSHLLKTEAVMDYTESIYNGRLDILGGTKQPESNQELVEILITILRDAYDIVWIDAHSGGYNNLSLGLLESADIVLVNLPQNRFVLDRFFEGYDFPEVLKDKEIIVLISSYDEESSFSVKKIKRRYKTKYEVLPIHYSHHFKDAANKLMLSEFFYRTHSVERQHPSYNFIKSLDTVNKVIAKRVGVRGR